MTNAAAPSDRPVFVDPSGRRRTLLRVAIGVVVAAVVGYLVLLAIALSGGPVRPSTLLPVPEVAQPTLVTTSSPAPETTSEATVSTTPSQSAETSAGQSNAGTSTAPATATDQNGRRDDAPGASNRPTTPGKDK